MRRSVHVPLNGGQPPALELPMLPGAVGDRLELPGADVNNATSEHHVGANPDHEDNVWDMLFKDMDDDTGLGPAGRHSSRRPSLVQRVEKEIERKYGDNDLLSAAEMQRFYRVPGVLFPPGPALEPPDVQPADAPVDMTQAARAQTAPGRGRHHSLDTQLTYRDSTIGVPAGSAGSASARPASRLGTDANDCAAHPSTARAIFVEPAAEDVIPDHFAMRYSFPSTLRRRRGRSKARAGSTDSDRSRLETKDGKQAPARAVASRSNTSDEEDDAHAGFSMRKSDSRPFIPKFMADSAGAVYHEAALDPSAKDTADFAEIVDEDDSQAYASFVSDVLVGKLVESKAFRMTILVAILINTLLVGLQTSATLERRYGAYMEALDQVLLTIFAFEILLKWYNNFWTFWKVGWNVFDFLLVFLSVVGNGMDFLRTGRVLRIFRVLRAFRSLRSISAIKGLAMVMQTIVHSLPDMANILALLLIVMFIFSVVGVDLFGRDVPQFFGSISNSMFTLFVTMTQDGWVTVYRTMEGEGRGLSGAIFFVVYIVVGAFIFANVVVAVTVTNLQTVYKQMKLQKKIKQRHRTLGEQEPGGGALQRTVKPISIKDVTAAVWRSQTPLIIPNYRAFTLAALENYYLMVLAMEDNLVERQDLQRELAKILARAKHYNEADKADPDASGTGSATPVMTSRRSSVVKSEQGRAAQVEVNDDAKSADILTAAIGITKSKETKQQTERRQEALRRREQLARRLARGDADVDEQHALLDRLLAETSSLAKSGGASDTSAPLRVRKTRTMDVLLAQHTQQRGAATGAPAQPSRSLSRGRRLAPLAGRHRRDAPPPPNSDSGGVSFANTSLYPNPSSAGGPAPQRPTRGKRGSLLVTKMLVPGVGRPGPSAAIRARLLPTSPADRQGDSVPPLSSPSSSAAGSAVRLLPDKT